MALQRPAGAPKPLGSMALAGPITNVSEFLSAIRGALMAPHMSALITAVRKERSTPGGGRWGVTHYLTLSSLGHLIHDTTIAPSEDVAVYYGNVVAAHLTAYQDALVDEATARVRRGIDNAAPGDDQSVVDLDDPRLNGPE